MIDCHVKHLEKVVLKYVVGLAENATCWEKRKYKRYGRIGIVCRQLNYDIKHGATNEQVVSLLQKIQNDSSFSDILDENSDTTTRDKTNALSCLMQSYNSRLQ